MDIAEERRALLEAARKNLELTQAQTAAALGLSLKAWNDLENGRSEARKIHVLAAERAALGFAAERGAIGMVPRSIIDDLKRLAHDVPSALVLAELILLSARERVSKDDEPLWEGVTNALFQTIRAGKIAQGVPAEGSA